MFLKEDVSELFLVDFSIFLLLPFIWNENRTKPHCFHTLKLMIYGQILSKQQTIAKVQKNQLLLYHFKTFTSWQLLALLATLLGAKQWSSEGTKHSFSKKTLNF